MSKILVLYQSSHGNTERILEDLVQKSTGEITLRKVKQGIPDDFDAYDKIVLGGSIHAGNIQKEVKGFAEKNGDLLLRKPLGLFIGCLDKEKAAEQLEASFPGKLKDHASVKACIGGEMDIKKLPVLLRPIVKAMAKDEEDRKFQSGEGLDALKAFFDS